MSKVKNFIEGNYVFMNQSAQKDFEASFCSIIDALLDDRGITIDKDSMVWSDLDKAIFFDAFLIAIPPRYGRKREVHPYFPPAPYSPLEPYPGP